MHATELLNVCLVHERNFVVLYPDNSDVETISIYFNDTVGKEKLHPMYAIVASTLKEFVVSMESSCGWKKKHMHKMGSVVSIQFTPLNETHMDLCEHLLSLESILDIEFKADGWWVSYLENTNARENSIRKHKRREPEHFRTPHLDRNTKRAGKKSV